MSELIARICSEYKNVLSHDELIVKAINFSDFEIIDYDPNLRIDDDQWFIIKNFSNKGYYIDICNNEFSTASLIQIRNEDYKKISNICIIQNSELHFQRITPSLFVNRKRFLDYSGAPRIVDQRKNIEIKNTSDAIYVRDVDQLFFKSISKIKTIFPGIESLHREATHEEVSSFLNNDFIRLDDYNTDSVGVFNRKRIADIGKKFQDLNSQKKKKLIKYAKEKSGIEFENGAFVIDSDTTLKNLLYAMDQRYYYADIYEENRIANSVRIINQ